MSEEETKASEPVEKPKKKRQRKKPKETAIAPVEQAAAPVSPNSPPNPPNSPPNTQRAPVGFGDAGIELKTMSEVSQFAHTLLKSGLAPTSFQNVESIIVAIQLGAEMGLKPMAALQSIAVINGRPAIWGEGMLAICRNSGIFDEQEFVETIAADPDTGELVATCSCRRLPNGNIVTREFSMSDAKQAKLLDKSGPWSQYTKRMLQMRARSWALRDAFPDVLRGLLTREEAEQIMESTPQSSPAQTQVEQLDQLSEELEAKANPVATVEPEYEDVDGRDFALDGE